MTSRAFDDLEIAPDDPVRDREIDDIVDSHALLLCFRDTFKDSIENPSATSAVRQIRDAITASRRNPLRPDLPDCAIRRIKRQTDSGDYWRGLTWYDVELDVVWLCRAGPIANDEDALYDSFATAYERGEVLPTDDERKVERVRRQRDRLVNAFRREIDAARSTGGQQRWHTVRFAHSDGTEVPAGAVYIYREEDSSAWVEERTVVVIAKPDGFEDAVIYLLIDELSETPERLTRASHIPHNCPVKGLPLFEVVEG